MWASAAASGPPVASQAAASGSSRRSATHVLVQQLRSCPVQWSQQQCAAARTVAAAAEAQAAAERATVPVTFLLGGQEITVEAAPGQNLWEVAKDAGADITLGCSQGSCGVCEVEVRKYSSGDGSAAPSTGVVRACIAGIPPGYARLEVVEVPLDDIWGVDGYDT